MEEDRQLHGLLVDLANAIRDVPRGEIPLIGMLWATLMLFGGFLLPMKIALTLLGWYSPPFAF